MNIPIRVRLNSALRIVMLKFGDPFRSHGENNSRYVLAEGFRKLGHRVIVIGGYGQEISKGEAVKVFDVTDMPEINTLAIGKPKLRLSLWYLWFTKGSRLIKKLKPDIIISDGAIPIPTINALAIMRIHDIITSIKHKIPIVFLNNKYHYLTFSSKYLKKDFTVRFKNIDKKKCKVIPLPVNIQLYKRTPLYKRKHAVLFVDRRSRRNLPFCLKIFNLLANIDRDLEFYIVGKVNSNIVTYNIDFDFRKRLHVLGFIDRSRLRELYSKVKLLVMPTSYEGFGYPVVEALAAGTPVVGSIHVPDEILVHGFNGFRLQTFNTNIWTEHILRLLEDRDLWRKTSLNALRHAKIFEPTTIAFKFIELFARLQEHGNDS